MTTESPIPDLEPSTEIRVKNLLVDIAREQVRRNGGPESEPPSDPRYVMNVHDRIEQLFEVLDLHSEALSILLQTVADSEKE